VTNHAEYVVDPALGPGSYRLRYEDFFQGGVQLAAEERVTNAFRIAEK
jgi:hypothetical protein